MNKNTSRRPGSSTPVKQCPRCLGKGVVEKQVTLPALNPPIESPEYYFGLKDVFKKGLWTKQPVVWLIQPCEGQSTPYSKERWDDPDIEVLEVRSDFSGSPVAGSPWSNEILAAQQIRRVCARIACREESQA